MNQLKILLIIPAYNEEASILTTIRSIERYKKKQANEKEFQLDYLVVNDGSTDKTEAILRKNTIPALHLAMNLGIGGAVQAGYKYAKEQEYDIAVQFDGDGQHNIESLETVIKPLISQESDFVIGSRFLPEAKASFQTTFMRRIGIRILSFLIQISCHYKLYDVTSGYRGANKKVIAYFAERYPTNYPEPESLVHLLKKKYKVQEVPVGMLERAGGQSSIRSFTSIRYMFEVGIAILISGFMKEED